MRDGTDKWFKNLDSSTYYASKIILILPLAQKISYHVDINDQYYQSQGLRLQTIWWLQGQFSCLSWQEKSRDCKELIWWLRVNCLSKWLRYSDESVHSGSASLQASKPYPFKEAVKSFFIKQKIIFRCKYQWKLKSHRLICNTQCFNSIVHVINLVNFKLYMAYSGGVIWENWQLTTNI